MLRDVFVVKSLGSLVYLTFNTKTLYSSGWMGLDWSLHVNGKNDENSVWHNFECIDAFTVF